MRNTYHVECHDILERDVAGAVAADEGLVDNFRAAAGGKTQNEGIRLGGLESLDAACGLLDTWGCWCCIDADVLMM